MNVGLALSPTAAILTLADVLAPAKTEIVPAPAVDGRLLSVEQAGKRLNLSSRLVYKKCLLLSQRESNFGPETF